MTAGNRIYLRRPSEAVIGSVPPFTRSGSGGLHEPFTGAVSGNQPENRA